MTVKTVKNNHGKYIVKAYSDLVNRESADEFMVAMESLRKDGEKDVVIDLTNIKMINSYGVGKIIMVYKRLKDLGGELYLILPLPPMIQETFDSLRITNIFKEYKV